MIHAKIYCPLNGRTSVSKISRKTRAELVAHATEELTERAETFGMDVEVYESDGWIENAADSDEWKMEILGSEK